MKELKYNLNQLTKPSQILRKAADMIQRGVEEHTTVYDKDTYFYRDGVCCTLRDIEEKAKDKSFAVMWYGSDMKPQSVARLERKVNQTSKAVEEARDLFASLFKRKTPYWFGKQRNDKQQQHRITALLLAAEIAEAEGK
jgi:hypothetical protein